MLWDVFCRVVDNWGDAGVCWRLADQLAAQGERVRLWIDDPAPLAWMAPEHARPGVPGVRVAPWPTGQPPRPVGDVLVEAFGCEAAPQFIAAHANRSGAWGGGRRWINLEYLSAEDFARRCHGLPSPQTQGPGAGLRRHFFFPGFTPDSGGLLREPELTQRQARFDRSHWLRALGVDWRGQRLVSLFCYEPPGLADLLRSLGADAAPTTLLVASGRAAQALHHALHSMGGPLGDWNPHGTVHCHGLPLLAQREFDHLLWACDLNVVRGEDSWVRALWAGQALLWQPYPQHDGAHLAKLDAFLDWMQAPASMRHWHHRFVGAAGTPAAPDAVPLPEWQAAVARARQTLLAQDDLVTRLRRFVTADS